MNRTRLTLVLLLAYLAVFLQAAWQAPRLWLGTPLSLLPPLVVYAALRLDLLALTLLALAGGVALDALSANPLGTSPLPLYLTGWLIWARRETLVQEQDYARLLLGALAGLLVPLFTLILVLSSGAEPDLGRHTLWQVLAGTVVAGVCTPVLFRLLDRLERWFVHPPLTTGAYRPDREIKRGRS